MRAVRKAVSSSALITPRKLPEYALCSVSVAFGGWPCGIETVLTDVDEP